MSRTLLFSVLLCCARAFSQPTVGVLNHTTGSLDSGYVFFGYHGQGTFLLDKCGHLAHKWAVTGGNTSTAYLLSDGSTLAVRLRLNGGTLVKFVLERRDWDNNLMWGVVLGDSTHVAHHDIYPLPNGNVLVLLRELHSRASAINDGRDSLLIAGSGQWGEQVVELQPVGTDSANIVWQWNAWDHIVQQRDATMNYYGIVADHPELININYTDGVLEPDVWHANAIMYNAALNQVLISSRTFSEFWIVDHGTTTAQAASHTGGKQGKGGDLLYRWGNPAAYGQGTTADQMLFGQHDPSWIPAGLPNAGKIMVLNNGVGRPDGQYSTIDIITPPVDSSGAYNTATLPYLPLAQDRVYTDSPATKFYTEVVGGAQMLANGNVLVCDGANGRFFELDSAGAEVWEYVSPVSDTGPVSQGDPHPVVQIFRCTFYPYSYPAFAGRAIVSGPPLELNPAPSNCELNVKSAVGERNVEAIADELFVYPNPASNHVEVSDPGNIGKAALYNSMGKKLLESTDTHTLNTSSLPAGIYSLVVHNAGRTTTKLISIVR